MGIITAVTPQQKNKNRVSIFIDDEFVCGLSLISATKFGLKVGKEISEESLNSAVFDSEVSVCFDTACRILGIHRKTVETMRKDLIKKGFEQRVVDTAILKLKEYHYLDDILFARDYIAAYGKKFGAKKLRYELKCKGVNEEIVEEALANSTGNENAAATVAEKYMRTNRKANKKKLYAHLFSKGFDSEEIAQAIENIKFREEDDDDNNTQRD